MAFSKRFTQKRAAEAPELVGWGARLAIHKLDKASRTAFGWASVVKDANGRVIIDHDSDVIPSEELEKAAYTYVLDSRDAGEMHERRGVGRLVESCFLDTAKRAAMGVPEGPTAWWVGYRIDDDAVLKRVESGELAELSIAGVADRVPLEGSPGVFKLLNLEIEEVSFVDKGAGIGVTVRLFKRNRLEVHPMLDLLKKCLANVKDASKRAQLEAKLKDVSKAATMEDIKAKLSAEEWDLIMASIAPPPTTEPSPEGGAADPKKPADPAMEMQMKALQKRADEQQAELAKARSELAEVQKRERLEKYRQEADKFEFAPGSRDDIAKQLMAADDNADKELGAAQRKLVEQAHEAVKSSETMRAQGSSRGGDTSSASAKLKKAAEKIVTDSGGKVGMAKAMKQAAEADPKLHAEVVAERKATAPNGRARA